MANGLNKRQRLLLRWTVLFAVITVATIAWAVAFRRGDDDAVLPGAQVEGLTSILTRDAPDHPSPIRFTDITNQSGISFDHFPARRASLLPEDMGSGVAVGDYDDDGLVDLFFVNFSGSIAPGAKLDPIAGRSRLYRNLGDGKFEDVTDSAGVGFVGHGMGAAWGDFDNDNDLDLYVTAFGDNALYVNNGDGTFREAINEASLQDDRFSAGCSWGDYDRDGDLDLYVCNYVAFVFRQQDRNVSNRQYDTEQPYTLNPSAYSAQSNSLFRNNGDGTFDEVAIAAGVADPNGRSLSASWVDFDNDGWIDLYVANDVSNNGVFRNNGDGTFSDVGPGSLAADYRGAMGIAVADYDNDLDQDILITHWIAQENALYRNMAIDELLDPDPTGRVWFVDSADQLGLGQISLDMVGWATGFCDFDNDGLRELWLVNGSTLETPSNHQLLDAQPPLLFWHVGDHGFVDVASKALGDAANPFVGRGGAQADLDGDGRVDLAWVVHGGRARILRNVSKPSGHWLRVELRQTGGNTRALGARVYVTAGGRQQVAVVGNSSSYLSQHELTLHFGLGVETLAESVRIVWPDGLEEQRQKIRADQTIRFQHDAVYPVR